MINFSVLKLLALDKITKLMKDEKGEVNIVAIVLLIGIVVVLAIVFKDSIVNLLQGIFKGMEGNLSSINGTPEPFVQPPTT